MPGERIRSGEPVRSGETTGSHEPERNDAPPTRRSFWSTYGQLILAMLALGIAMVVTLSMPGSPSGSPGQAAETQPASTAPNAQASPESMADYDKRKSDDLRAVITAAAKRTGGDWNKATAEEKARMNSVSRGHGKEMLQMYYERSKSENSPEKPTGIPRPTPSP